MIAQNSKSLNEPDDKEEGKNDDNDQGGKSEIDIIEDQLGLK